MKKIFVLLFLVGPAFSQIPELHDTTVPYFTSGYFLQFHEISYTGISETFQAFWVGKVWPSVAQCSDTMLVEISTNLHNFPEYNYLNEDGNPNAGWKVSFGGLDSLLTMYRSNGKNEDTLLGFYQGPNWGIFMLVGNAKYAFSFDMWPSAIRDLFSSLKPTTSTIHPRVSSMLVRNVLERSYLVNGRLIQNQNSRRFVPNRIFVR